MSANRDVAVSSKTTVSLVEAFYQTADHFIQLGNIESAEGQLREALAIDSEHLASRLLLGEVFTEHGRLNEALAELEIAHRIDENAAHVPMIEALLKKGERHEKRKEREDALRAYERVLELSFEDVTARSRISQIWARRAELLFDRGELDEAIAAYRKAGDGEKVAELERQVKGHSISRAGEEAKAFEREKNWQAALARYEWLSAEDVDGVWGEALERAKIEVALDEHYSKASEALSSDDWDAATNSLLKILIVRPDYRDVPELFVDAVRRGKNADRSETVGTIGADAVPEERTVGRTQGASQPAAPRPTIETALQQTAPEETRVEPNPLPARSDVRWFPMSAAILALCSVLVVGYLVTAPAGQRNSAPTALSGYQENSTDEPSLDARALAQRLAAFISQERRLPAAPAMILVGLIIAAMAGGGDRPAWVRAAPEQERDSTQR